MLNECPGRWVQAPHTCKILSLYFSTFLSTIHFVLITTHPVLSVVGLTEWNGWAELISSANPRRRNVFNFMFHVQIMRAIVTLTVREHVPFIQERGEWYRFPDNATCLLDVLYSSPWRVLSADGLLCVLSRVGGFLSLCVTVNSLSNMKSRGSGTLLSNPEGLTPKQDV